MTLVLVGGALANRPGNGGGAWVRLSFARGLRRLGFDVLFVEQIEPGTCRDAGGAPAAFEDSVNVRWFRDVTEAFDLDAVLVCGAGERTCGRPYAELVALAAEAELLVNISGHLTLPGIVAGPRRRAYVDLDPGFTQIWHEQGTHEIAGHDAYFTVGENVGRPGCDVPTAGIRWRAVRQPVVLDDWPWGEDGRVGVLTTVASWRGPYAPVQLDGRTLGIKAHEFRRFWDLPGRAPQGFELALAIDPADEADRQELLRRGWRLADPVAQAGDPERFRRYVSTSAGEFAPAQGVYVHTRSGWFSDRTARYLAAGRPVLVQDTGVPWASEHDAGLLTFRTLDEAVAGARAIERDYDAHREAARAIARERFDSDVVLARLVDDAGAGG